MHDTRPTARVPVPPEPKRMDAALTCTDGEKQLRISGISVSLVAVKLTQTDAPALTYRPAAAPEVYGTSAA